MSDASTSAVAAAASDTSVSSLLSSVFSVFGSARDAVGAGWTWVKDHKRAVVGGAAVTAAIGGYIIYRKVQPMVAQLREELKMMEQLANQLNPQSSPAQKHAILIHRLEHNLTVGDLTLRQFAPKIRTDLTTRFDVDSIRGRLKKSGQSAAAGGGAAGSKEEQELLWEEFKTSGFARTLSCVYILSLLHALVKLQVSIVSRYVLVDQQAQAARAEAEIAAQEAAGIAPGSRQQPSSHQLPQQPLTYLPPNVCEEVNRIYFSLSKHACELGAVQLADAIAAITRVELNDSPVKSTFLTPPSLTSLLARLRTRIDEDGLGLECKEGEESLTNKDHATPASSTASASGASASSTIFHSNVPFARFLLPPTDALSIMVQSTTFPDQAVSNMASFRLAEMLAETNAVIASHAFASVIAASTKAAMEELNKQLQQSVFSQPHASAETQIPMANVLVSIIKLFGVLLPDVSGPSSSSSASTSVSSPLFHLLADLPAVKELCAVVYLPADAILASPQPGQLSTLEQITSNRQFAGPSGFPPRQTQSPLHIEEIPASDRPLAARLPMAAQLQHAVQDIKGLPTFDRL